MLFANNLFEGRFALFDYSMRNLRNQVVQIFSTQTVVIRSIFKRKNFNRM